MGDMELKDMQWTLQQIKARRAGTRSSLEALAAVTLDVSELLLTRAIQDKEQRNAEVNDLS